MKVWAFIVWTVLVSVTTYFYATKNKSDIKVVYKDKVVSVPVIRKYITMTPKQKDYELFKYDTDPFKLDIQKIDTPNFNYRITGELHRRKAHRDIRIEAGQSGNFKFYVGAAVAVGAVYGVYRLVK